LFDVKGGGWKLLAQLAKSSVKEAPTRILMFVFMMVFFSWRRWLFEPKLFVAHMAAGKSDVAADTESRTSDDKRCNRDRQ
jgi:hypothetical protein